MCECILSSDKLQYKNEDFWIKSFQLVRKIIGGVDYKGVREIMKVYFSGLVSIEKKYMMVLIISRRFIMCVLS